MRNNERLFFPCIFPSAIIQFHTSNSIICISMVLQVISQGAISSPMYSLKGPSMIKSLYPTAFPLKHQQKVCQVGFIALHHITS